MTEIEKAQLLEFETFVNDVCKIRPVFKKESGITNFAYYMPEIFELKKYVDKTTKSCFEKMTEKLDDGNVLKLNMKKSMKEIKITWFETLLK